MVQALLLAAPPPPPDDPSALAYEKACHRESSRGSLVGRMDSRGSRPLRGDAAQPVARVFAAAATDPVIGAA
jgi:hypothetical protein